MTAACPVCHRPTEPAVRPFCSRRCADVDLVRWLSGAYRIPVTDDVAAQATLGDDPESHGLIPSAP